MSGGLTQLYILVYKALNGLSPQYQLITVKWLPSANDFDRPMSLRARFQELAQVWMSSLSLVLDCNSGTAYL